MPSTTFLVQPSSMPITTTAATFGLEPAPISVRKWSSRSAPNCRRPYGWGIAIVPLTLCATASLAAFDRSSSGRMMTWLRTPTRPFSRRYPRNVVSLEIMMDLSLEWVSNGMLALRRPAAAMPLAILPLPAHGLDVVDVRMLAGAHAGHHLADVLAILDHGVAYRHVLHRDLVPDRDVLQRLDTDRAVVVHDPGIQFGSGLDAFHDSHRDCVIGVVQHNVNHRSLLG